MQWLLIAVLYLSVLTLAILSSGLEGRVAYLERQLAAHGAAYPETYTAPEE